MKFALLPFATIDYRTQNETINASSLKLAKPSFDVHSSADFNNISRRIEDEINTAHAAMIKRHFFISQSCVCYLFVPHDDGNKELKPYDILSLAR